MKTKTISSLFPVPFFLLLLSGCSLFDLRDPEEPAQSRSSFIEPFSPEDVPENLKAAFYYGNTNNYKRCLLSETFVFIPSPEFQNEIPNLNSDQDVSSFDGLNRDIEFKVGDVISREAIILDWTGISVVNQIDSVEWKADYTLQIPNIGATDYSKYIQGKVILNLKRIDNLWYISKWRDYSVSGGYCWSQLKQRFR